MKTKETFFTVALIVCLLFSTGILFAGGDKKKEAAPVEEEITVEKEVKEVDPFDYETASIDWKQQKGKTLKVFHSKHGFTASLQPFIPEFEELTGIKVNLEVYPDGDPYWNKMLIELNAGANPPDVFMLNYISVAQYDKAGWLEPLGPYVKNKKLTPEEWYDYDDFFASALDFGSFNGKQYGLPITGEWQILFYRKDIYKEKGLKVPETMDELYANAKALDSPKVSGIVNRLARASAAWWPWAGFVRTYGGYWINPDGEPMLTSKPVKDATEMYIKLLKDCGPDGILNYTWYECVSDFQAGKTAHFIDSSMFMAFFENPEVSTVAGKVGYAALPSAEKGKPSVPNVNHWMLGMGNQSNNKEAAWLYIMWATSKKTALEVALGAGTACRTSTWHNETFLQKSPEKWVKTSLQAADTADKLALPQIPEQGELGEYLEIGLNEIFSGKPVDSVLENVQNKTIEVLRE